jgi:hypothetical protein
MSILGTVACFTSSTLCGTGLNRHIGYEASVLHSKPSDNFGEVTITGLASVDQRSAISDQRLAISEKSLFYL